MKNGVVSCVNHRYYVTLDGQEYRMDAGSSIVWQYNKKGDAWQVVMDEVVAAQVAVRVWIAATAAYLDQ